MNHQTDTPEARYARIVETLAESLGVTLGSPTKKGFGSGTLQADGKIFAMLDRRGNFVVKLPKERVAALIASSDGAPYDGGKGLPMHEWLIVRSESEAQWLSLAKDALAFVGSGGAGRKRGR